MLFRCDLSIIFRQFLIDLLEMQAISILCDKENNWAVNDKRHSQWCLQTKKKRYQQAGLRNNNYSITRSVLIILLGVKKDFQCL